MKRSTYWKFNAALLLMTLYFWVFAVPTYYILSGILWLMTFLYGFWKESTSRIRKKKSGGEKE